MSRHARYTLTNIPQYVVQKGNNGESIFLEVEDYLYYKDCLKDASLQYGCKIYAYVFLRNHVHLLITQQAANGIAQLFQSLGRRYVRYFNDRHGRSGTLWEGRYKSCLVESEQYLMACHRYIELYPVRQGLVKSPENHSWSSAASYVLGVRDKLITTHPAYYSLAAKCDERQQLYKNYLMQGVPKNEAQLIGDAIKKSGVLGNELFKIHVERVLGWSVRPRKPGRPRRVVTEKAE